MSAYRLTKEWQAVDERSGVLQNTGEQNMEYLILNEEPSLAIANSGKVLNPQNKIFFELQEGYNLYIRAFNVFDGGFIPTASVESIVDFFHREDNPLEGTTNSLTIGVSVWNPKTSYYPEDWVVIAKNLMWKCSVAHDNDSDFDADVARGYWQNIITAINSIEIDGTNIVLKNTKDEETEIPITALSAVEDADGNVITDTYATKTELSNEVDTLNNTIADVEDGLVRSVTKKDDTTITITKGDDTTTSDIQLGTQTYATKTELSDAVDGVEDDIDAVDDTYSFLIRKPSTAYTYGTKVFLPSLNVSMCLQCSVAGTTSNTSLVISNPTVDDTVTDGTCEWTIKEVGSGGSGGDGVPVGAIIAYASNGELPSGYLLCDASAVSRTMFADLYAKIGTTYGEGDGSTTFNLPSVNDAKRFLQGDTFAGIEKEAGLPNITGRLDQPSVYQGGVVVNGAFYRNGVGGGSAASANGNSYRVEFDASLSNPIYGNSTTVQPNALTTRYIIKAFDGQTADSALIDITQYAQELATKANRQLSNLDNNNLSVHVVVDSYYNGTTGDWYRVYDDGWVEQGGYSNVANLTLLKPYNNTNYSVIFNGVYSGRTGSIGETYANSKTTTNVNVYSHWTSSGSSTTNEEPYYWVAFGMGASV